LQYCTSQKSNSAKSELEIEEKVLQSTVKPPPRIKDHGLVLWIFTSSFF
jgi:hypothetical protein